MSDIRKTSQKYTPLSRFWTCVCVIFLVVAGFNRCGPGAEAKEGWLTFRSDNTRSGYSSQSTAPPLSLQWSYASPQAPMPAWPAPGEEMARMQMDNAFHAVSAFGLVYFGSSVDHKVYALDIKTGREKWHFWTDGPVRYAPTIWEDRLFVGSDDGFIYCLKAKSGRLLWKHRPGPSAERVLGNGSMISLWPLRTSVLVDDGIVYCCAGVFPYEGISICALHAGDGTVVWKNDTIGDHEHELIFGGISPQGYLVASERILYVPSSRAMPAAFDKKSGDFLYYLEPGGKIGGTWTVLDRGHLIAGVDLSGTPAKAAYDEQTGERREDMHAWFPGIDLVVTADTSFSLTREGIYALDRHKYVNLQQNQLRDIRGKREQLRAKLRDISTRLAAAAPGTTARLTKERDDISLMLTDLAAVEDLLKPGMFAWEYPHSGLNTMILAGGCLFAGGKDILLGCDAMTGNELWKTEITGNVRGLSAVEGYLFVSTEEGGLFCYAQAEKDRSGEMPPETAPAPWDEGGRREDFRAAAEQIIAETGIRKGYALVLGCETGRLAYELARASDLKVIGVAPTERKAAAARKWLSQSGHYGHKVVVADWKLETLPDYFANLIVSEGLSAGGTVSEPAEEVFRVLKPYGGTAIFGAPGQSPRAGDIDLEGISEWFSSGVAGGSVQIRSTEAWISFTRGGLAGAGNWTEEYGNPGNTACSGDELVKGPLGILWFGGPGSKQMVERHAKAQSPLSMDGRMFMQGEEVIMAYDAYNGTLLWEREIPGAVRARADVDGGNFSLNRKGLFVGAFDRCFRLDPVSGETLAEFKLPDTPDDGSFRWAHVSADGTRLFGSRARALKREYLALYEAVVDNGKWRPPQQIPVEYLDQYEALRSKYPQPDEGLMEDFKRSGVLWRLMTDFPDWENYQVKEGALTDRLMVSDVVFAMDAETGQLNWQYPGKRIAHISISKGNGKIFFAESAISVSQRNRAQQETRRLTEAGIYVASEEFPVPWKDHDFRTVVALDIDTGRQVWQRTLDFTGCGGDALASACHNGVLLFFSNMGSHDWWRHESGALRWKRITALDAETGEVLWSHPNNYRTRPVIVGERVFIEPRVCDLRTGEILSRIHPISGQSVPFEYLRPGHTCAISSASASMLFYRSACAAIMDFENDNGVALFGGIRPGCWINMIPAGGVLLFPEASAGCTCSFPLRGSLVLKHKPGRWQKGTVYIAHGPMTPVKHWAVNLGASSDLKDDEGTVWFAYPNPDTNYTHNHYPDYGVKFALNENLLPGMGYFNADYRNKSIAGTKRPWLFTSGALGATRFEMALIDEVWGEKPGVYTVRLGFKAPAEDRKGQRVFDVKLQGTCRLEAFDIRAQAGPENQAVVRSITGVPVENVLIIEFQPGADNPGIGKVPMVNFIEVIREDGIAPARGVKKGEPMTPKEAAAMLSSARLFLKKGQTSEALEKYHTILDRAPNINYKKQALEGLAILANPNSLPEIAPYCKNLDPVMRDYQDLDPELKQKATRVFLAIADRISQSEKKRAVRMFNRALQFTDPEDLETLREITTRLVAAGE